MGTLIPADNAEVGGRVVLGFLLLLLFFFRLVAFLEPLNR